jgi:hypothetical protein
MVRRVTIGDLSRYGLTPPAEGIFTRLRRDGTAPAIAGKDIIPAIRTRRIQITAGIQPLEQASLVLADRTALAGVHAAAGTADAGLIAFGWRGLWLTFTASAVPTIMFTVTGIPALRQAGLSPPWVSALGWLSAAAHLIAIFTLAQRGAFAPDGIIAALIPLSTVTWILAQAATLPSSWRAATGASPRNAG